MWVYHLGAVEIEIDPKPLKRLAGGLVLLLWGLLVFLWLLWPRPLPGLMPPPRVAEGRPAPGLPLKEASRPRLKTLSPLTHVPTPFAPRPVAFTVDPAHLLTLTGPWHPGEETSAHKAVTDVALRLAETVYQIPELLALTGPVSPEQAFLQVYGGPVEFRRVSENCQESRAARGISLPCGDGMWGETLHQNLVLVYETPTPTQLITHPHWFVHELGHAFSQATGDAPEAAVPRAWTRDDALFAGALNVWQFSTSPTPNEIFADLFLAWVYATWGPEPGGSAWMTENMSPWLQGAIHNQP